MRIFIFSMKKQYRSLLRTLYKLRRNHYFFQVAKSKKIGWIEVLESEDQDKYSLLRDVILDFGDKVKNPISIRDGKVRGFLKKWNALMAKAKALEEDQVVSRLISSLYYFSSTLDRAFSVIWRCHGPISGPTFATAVYITDMPTFGP